MCAEASKPVMVYCAISNPRPKANQNAGWPNQNHRKPELLIVSPNTKLTD